MKKLICLVICLVLAGGVLGGCNGEEIKRSDDNKASDTTDADYTTTAFEEFMEEQGTILTAKDVQYDMINTLDQSFAIEGNAKLSDYYNYGFKESSSQIVFVVRIQPTDENYSDGWYLYCDRESFANLFGELKEQGEIHIFAKCLVPKALYQENQGNMALAESISW